MEVTKQFEGGITREQCEAAKIEIERQRQATVCAFCGTLTSMAAITPCCDAAFNCRKLNNESEEK